MPTEPKAEGTAASTDSETAYMDGLTARLRGEVIEDEAEEAPPAAKDKAPKDEPADDADEPEGDDEADEKPDAEPDADEEAAEDEDGDEDDDQVNKDGLRRLQKEKRSFEKVKTEVLALERTVKEREQQVEQAKAEIKAFLTAFNGRPVETMLERNMLDQESIDYLARQLFLHTTEAKKDPRSKHEAERLQRDREQRMEARRAHERVEKLERELEAKKFTEQEERKLNTYVSRLDTSFDTYKAKTPLLTKAMAKDPASTKRELYAVAYELATANDGQFAEPGKVLLAWEKQQRARLERLGLSAPAAEPSGNTDNKAKSKTAAKSQGQGAKKKEDEVVDDDPVLEGEAYHAELARRLKRSG